MPEVVHLKENAERLGSCEGLRAKCLLYHMRGSSMSFSMIGTESMRVRSPNWIVLVKRNLSQS